MSEPEFTIERLDPRLLTAHPGNFRRHPERQRAALAASIAEHGYLAAPIWNRTSGHLLDGHARVELALEREEPSIPVRVIEVGVRQEKRILASFDRIGELRERDDEALAALLAELAEEGELPAGWDDADLAALIEPGSGLLPGADPDAIPEAVETRCQPGDLWKLGAHRLLCGDSTKPADVERLARGESVLAMLTDPPYRMGKDIANDHLGDDPFYALHVDAMRAAPLGRQASMVWFHGTRSFPVALDAARCAGWTFERMLWLSKPNDCTFPWRGWILKSESILVFSQGGGHWHENHPFHHDTYEFNHRGGELAEGVGHHPTVKPCEVVVDLIERITATGELVYDAFAGSGTTLIACEQSGRSGLLMEIEPRYCDVILARWEQATGQEAERL